MPKEIQISDKSGITEDKIETSTPPVKEIPKNKETKDSRIKTPSNINKNLLIFGIVAFFMLSGITLFFYFGIYKVRPIPPESVLPSSEDFIASVKSAQDFDYTVTPVVKPKEPKTEASPLNGVLFTKTQMAKLMKRRPVAVMSSNHSAAKPYSGISSSDIVIETNVEGGITRSMVIYWSTEPARVGSVRSVRQYFLEWASEYDALLIRIGCASSPTKDPRINACYNLITYDNVIDIDVYWRWNDSGRYAPHNGYSSVKTAWSKAEKRDLDNFTEDFESWSFKRDADIEDRGTKTVAEVVFHKSLNYNGRYNVTWTYQKDGNNYLRKKGGEVEVDQETGDIIYAKNVVIQKTKMQYSGDYKGHMIITTIDKGDAVFLIDGKVINGTWKKNSRNSRTLYYDSDGNPIQFNRGRIWVEVVSTYYGDFDIIEQ